LNCYLVAAAIALAAASAVAAEEQDIQVIRAAVQAAAAGRIATPRDGTVDIDVAPIDSRLHFPACPALDVSLPAIDSTMLTARVSCGQPAWAIFVPVRIHVWSPAVVAATNLAPNTKLGAADMTLAKVDLYAGSGAYLTDPAQAEGKILRANIRAGAPILAALLEAPVLIRRGQSVLLTLSDATINIKTTVTAMEDGKAGDTILVQNPDTRKTVRVLVSDAGTVEMRFGGAMP